MVSDRCRLKVRACLTDTENSAHSLFETTPSRCRFFRSNPVISCCNWICWSHFVQMFAPPFFEREGEREKTLDSTCSVALSSVYTRETLVVFILRRICVWQYKSCRQAKTLGLEEKSRPRAPSSRPVKRLWLSFSVKQRVPTLASAYLWIQALSEFPKKIAYWAYCHYLPCLLHGLWNIDEILSISWIFFQDSPCSHFTEWHDLFLVHSGL